MLKRCQILLEDWQEEYLKNVSERYDLSFSEVIRIGLSEALLYIISLLQPEHKSKLTEKQFRDMIIKLGKNDIPAYERHKIIGTIYFEARKATEYRQSKIKKKIANH